MRTRRRRRLLRFSVVLWCGRGGGMAPVCCCLFLRSWRFSCRVLLLPFVGVSSQCSLPQSRLTPALCGSSRFTSVDFQSSTFRPPWPPLGCTEQGNYTVALRKYESYVSLAGNTLFSLLFSTTSVQCFDAPLTAQMLYPPPVLCSSLRPRGCT